jgi:hypothetical protein
MTTTGSISMCGREAPAEHASTSRPVVIDSLERVLLGAKAGEVVGMAAVFVHREPGTSSALVGVTSRAQLGLLEVLKSRLIEHLKED